MLNNGYGCAVLISGCARCLPQACLALHAGQTRADLRPCLSLAANMSSVEHGSCLVSLSLAVEGDNAVYTQRW